MGVTVIRMHGNTHRNARCNGVAIADEGLAYFMRQTSTKSQSLRLVGDCLEGNELISAQTPDKCVVTDDPFQKSGCSFQQFIANLVARQIIDSFELVEIKKERRHCPALKLVVDIFHHPVEMSTAGQTG